MGRHKNKTLSCPRHGIKYMVTFNAGVRYCAAPTPGELSSKCFFHPTSKYAPFKVVVDNDPVKPNVIKSLEHEYEMHKKYKATNRLKMRKRREENVPAEIQSQRKTSMESSRNSKGENGSDKGLPPLTLESLIEDDDEFTED